MNKKSTIFERILYIIEYKGFKNIAELAESLGYGSPQKLYRLKQGTDSKPSYDIIKDFSNKFEDLNLRWFVTGVGDAFYTSPKASASFVSEPKPDYIVTEEVQKLKARIKELEIERKSLLLALREIGAGHSASNSEKDAKKKS